MSVILKVNSVDKSSMIDLKSIKKHEVITKEADTLEFLIKNYGTKTYQPVLNDDVTLFNGSTKIFGGIIVELKETVIGMSKFLKVYCKDYTHLLDRQLVSKSYTSQSAHDIIADLISTFTTGFTTTNVVAPDTIASVKFNYITVSQAITKLASMLPNFDWRVDYDKDIHFFEVVTNPSPYDLSDSNDSYAYNSLELKQEITQIKNEIIVRGGKAISSGVANEYFDGDGTKLIFTLGTEFNTTPSVTVGGVAKTVGIANVDVAASFDCLWDAANKTISFRGGTVPASGTANVRVYGTYFYPLIFRKQNQVSIATYGLFQYIIVDKNITSVDEANARADAELAKYATPVYSGSFLTYSDGLIAGQYITVSSLIRGASQGYKIQSIDTIMRTTTTLQYKVSIQSAEDITMNDILRKLLLEDIADQIGIDTAENVQRYVEFEEELTSTDSVAAPTKTSPPYVWGTMVWGFFTWHS